MAWSTIEKQREYDRKRYSARAEEQRARVKAWRENNPEKYAALRRRSNARMVETGYSAEHCRARRAKTRKMCDATRAMYALARAYRSVGLEVHVDHIVPLKGRSVSGLHVIANLQLLTGLENRRKGNRHV